MEYNLIWNPNETYKDYFEPLDDRKEAINDAAMMEDFDSKDQGPVDSPLHLNVWMFCSSAFQLLRPPALLRCH